MPQYECEASVGAATERRRQREREESQEKGRRETGQIGGRESSDVSM